MDWSLFHVFLSVVWMFGHEIVTMWKRCGSCSAFRCSTV